MPDKYAYMTLPLRIWITTPSRTASRFLARNLRDNLVCTELYCTHDPEEAPRDPPQWHCIINTRLDPHVATVSMLIHRRRREQRGPGTAAVEEYLHGLHTHYNYALAVRPLPWRTVRHWHMEHIVAPAYPWPDRIDPEWPRRSYQWQCQPRINAGPDHREWIHNLDQLEEIGGIVAQLGHYRGHQIVKDPQDPRYSDQHRPDPLP